MVTGHHYFDLSAQFQGNQGLIPLVRFCVVVGGNDVEKELVHVPVVQLPC